ncbi:MAG: methionine--tRNA ligase [Lentisphaerae bacterium]|nr:methionine--tRNA ligase [Lentisphaerota bacterium]
MNSKFYVTTPIYYVNDKPHIGHAYTTVLADVLASFHRSMGDDTYFLTGTDEHGQKVENAAAKNGISPQQHADETVVRFQELWKELGITNDDFIRTTEARHKEVVREVLQELYDKGEIYKDEYTGWYCVGCERYFTEKDLVEGKCPDCGREVSALQEPNYFFRMSKYQDWLIDYIKTHPGFIQPAFRANETLGFLKQPLVDLCISRPKARLSWGIELPFDSDYVCYVWFDALINYISAVGYRRNDAEFARRWPARCQLIGKDILNTHSVYWPTMLKAMGIEMPKTIFAHGWWLTGNTKMSKSLGNVVNPREMIGLVGVDAFRYFLMAEMTLGNDASFTKEALLRRYNSDLANDLGNLLSRVVKLTLRAGGVIPAPGESTGNEAEFNAAVESAVSGMRSCLENMKLDQGLAAVLNAVRAGNRYVEQCAPWAMAKNNDTAHLNTVLYTVAANLRKLGVLLAPVMPGKMAELQRVLGGENEVLTIGDLASGNFADPAGRTVLESEPLFPRIQIEEEKAAAPCAKPEKKSKEKAAPAPEAVELVTIDQFCKVKLKTAKVVAAEKLEGADKLLKLKIDIGEAEVRPLVAGVAKYYTPEEIMGKTIVVVSNLQPATIRGAESRGMLLAAKFGKELRLVTVDGDVPAGADIG